MAFVVEITGYDLAAGVEKTFRFAGGKGLAFQDAPYALGQLKSWSSPSQRVDLDASGAVRSDGDEGSMVIDNAPLTIGEPGPLDDLVNYAWSGRRASIYYVAPGAPWSSKILIDWAVMKQPTAPLTLSGSVESTLQFALADVRSGLTGALQPKKYAGTNTEASGIEGTASDLKGKPKPVLYGRASNVPGVRVNQSLLIYQVADKAAEVLCVRDGAVSINKGVIRASLASLTGTDPASGTYDVHSGAAGTFIRLGSDPVKAIGIDVQEGATLADRSHGAIWKRLRQERASTPADKLVLLPSAAADTTEAGFWWAEEITLQGALDEVLGGFSAFEAVRTTDSVWQMGKLVQASADGAPKVTVTMVRPDRALSATHRVLTNIQRAVPAYVSDSPPPFRINVEWGRNYQVMGDGDFNGGAVQRLRDKFALEYRTETASDLTLWNPDTRVGPWVDAPEMTLSTGYQGDGESFGCPGAAAEAARLLGLYKVIRAQYVVGFRYVPGDTYLVGDIAAIDHPQMGLEGGKRFAVLQPQFSLSEEGRATWALILGMGT